MQEMVGGSAPVSRRAVLGGAGALALIAMLEGCKSRGSGAAGPEGPPIERALQLLRDAVRESPDHLAKRADAAVASKDAGTIVAFVRDHIAVVPAWSEDEEPTIARRWGSATTLRGGQGTVRERADLLAELLTKAGIQAEVKTAERPATIDLPTLYRDRLPAFTPDQKRIDQAMSVLASAGVKVPPAPPTPAPAEDPAAAIAAAVPAAKRQVTLRPDLLPERVPVVTFTDKGAAKYAFALGDLDVATSAPEGLNDADPAGKLQTIKVTVSGLSNPGLGSQTPRGELIELVQGEWNTEVVVGHQILLSFIPPEGPQVALQTKSAADLPVRVPILRVQTADPATAPPAQAGPIVSVQGEIYKPGKSGQLEGPYGPIKNVSAAEREKAIAAAATIKVEANATVFPEVMLDVSVQDKNGRSVDGLDASAFVLTDSAGQPASVTVRSNAADTSRPRVLIAYDTSGSVTEAWSTPAAQAAFEQSLATTLQAAAGQTAFDVQVVGLGQAPDKEAWKAPTADGILTALRAVNSDSSVWDTVGGLALDQGLVAIVLVSDNVSALEDTTEIPQFQRRLANAGVPVFCLPIGQPDEKATAKILALSHGTRLDARDKGVAGKLAALIKPLAAKRAAATYRLTYLAPAKGPVSRTVTVALTGRATPKGQTAYQVPAKPAAPSSFVGLYVTFEFNGQVVRRRLAGLPLGDRGEPVGALDDAAAAADTRAAIYGITTIAVEPGITTQAAMLDDVLSSYVSIEPLRPIWKTATPDEIVKKAGTTVRRVPGLFTSLFSPLPVVAGAIPTLRVAILQERQLPGGKIRQHLDLPPDLNQIVALGPDAAAAFQAAVRTSASASIAEAATLPDSAFIRVSGKKLSPILSGDSDATAAFLATVPPAGKAGWGIVLGAYQDKVVLVPAAGAGDAFWVVDPQTGAATAVLRDGTGGAVGECPALDGWDKTNLVLGVIGLGCTIVSPTGLYGAYACLAVTVVSIALTGASIISPGPNPSSSFGFFSNVFGAANAPWRTMRPVGLGGRIGVAGVVIGLGLISLQCLD